MKGLGRRRKRRAWRRAASWRWLIERGSISGQRGAAQGGGEWAIRRQTNRRRARRGAARRLLPRPGLAAHMPAAAYGATCRRLHTAALRTCSPPGAAANAACRLSAYAHLAAFTAHCALRAALSVCWRGRRDCGGRAGQQAGTRWLARLLAWRACDHTGSVRRRVRLAAANCGTRLCLRER